MTTTYAQLWRYIPSGHVMYCPCRDPRKEYARSLSVPLQACHFWYIAPVCSFSLFLFKGRTNLRDPQVSTPIPFINCIPNVSEEDRDIRTMKNDYSPSSSPSTHNENMHEEGRTYRATSVAGLPPLQEHGPVIDHKIPQDDVVQAQPDLAWSRVRNFMREPFSEFLGKHIESKASCLVFADNPDRHIHPHHVRRRRRGSGCPIRRREWRLPIYIMGLGPGSHAWCLYIRYLRRTSESR